VDVNVRTVGSSTVVELAGNIDGSVSNEAVEGLRSLVRPGAGLVLDLGGVLNCSAVGLRLLVALSRRVRAAGGTLSITRAPAMLRDAAEATGFTDLFGGALPVERQSGTRPWTELLPRIDVYPTHYYGGFALRPGFPLPFGATPVARGVNFSVYSRHAGACTLVLFAGDDDTPMAEIPFPAEARVGDVFAMIVFDLDVDKIAYGYRMDGPSAPAEGHRFDRRRILLDPMARAVSGRDVWGAEGVRTPSPVLRARLVPEDFEWEGDRPLALRIEDLVIYEMHVRGFTRSPSSGVRFPGSFAGIREKIPHLKTLGINCVELMPVFEFDEQEISRSNPLTGERLVNYWGYNTVGFYAPKAGYAATGGVGMQVDEFKMLVKDLHRHGIEVVLDVVFNHTAEGAEEDPTFSFRGLDNKTYYMLKPDGSYWNFSGCGNTLNCNHPVVRDFVVSCLRYWVAEYHVDGFRFDLASILGRDQSGAPLKNPPLLETLAADPVLGRTKLIAEAWDAAGLYQVGNFPAYGRWAEWNGRYRDCVRRFLRGDPGQVTELAQRLMGSPDLYPDRGPAASINFVTCHDGFTLADLVSYERKHNEANGEDNRDGSDQNDSSNCGVEGPTDDPGVQALRRQLVKSALAILLVSQGVPMLLMGDECGRTQQGNNNTYCHDGPLTWFDWDLVTGRADLVRFCARLIAFRRHHRCLRHSMHPDVSDGGDGAQAQAASGGTGPSPGTQLFPETTGADRDRLDVSWHGVEAWRPDWSWESRSLAFMLAARGGGVADDVVYAAFNMYWQPLVFELPRLPKGWRWHRFADTSARAGADAHEPGEEPALDDQRALPVDARSVAVLIARADAASWDRRRMDVS
jgi:glycogen operon protein